VNSSRRTWAGWARRLIPLLYLIPLAYVLRPVLWDPLSDRFFNFFHSQRPVAPWTEVVVVGIDRATREDAFERPVFPLSRHTVEHAQVARTLDRAGARAIVFDLAFNPDLFAEAPGELAQVFEEVGNVHLVMSLREERLVTGEGDASIRLRATLPDSVLVAAAEGAYIADVLTDADGIIRRLEADPRLGRLGLKTLPAKLADFDLVEPIPIEFPTVERRIPTVSYRAVLEGDESLFPLIDGRIAFIGLVEDPSTDFVSVPRRQLLGHGVEASGLPGVVVLASITETLLRGAPIRDAGWLATLLWNVLWCVACIAAIPKKYPTRAALAVIGVIAVSLIATGVVHAHADYIFPAGLLFGCVFLTGAHAIIRSYVDTAKDLHLEEVENERVQKEMRLAREAQERFLPDEIPTVPGADLWGINVSSLAVSGDYFDAIDLGDGRPLIICIADVSGKGLPASLVMSNVQAGLHCHVFTEPFDIKATSDHLNKLVYQNTDAGKFVTFFLGEYDKETHLLRFVRAGHDAPILVSVDGTVRMIEDGDFMLGFVPETDYTVHGLRLSHGDVFFLYTDGVTEARNPADEEFEPERLCVVVAENRDKTAQGIGEAVLAAVRGFSQLEQQADDVTLVILKIGESPDD